jgi:arginase family enzyme
MPTLIMDFSLMGICLDRKSFRRGAHMAPFHIKSVFGQLETYVNGVDLQDKVFLNDLGCIEPAGYSEIGGFLKKIPKKSFPIFIGGDHSISHPLVSHFKPKNFVSFDAHPDCEGGELCYFSVTRKIAEDGVKPYLYGARSISKAEDQYIKDGKVKIATLGDLKKLKGPTYLSIDFDVLDSSIMPAVAVPEPNGLTFNQVIEGVRALAKNLVAVDFVEFLPSENVTYTLIAGKLIYSAIAEIYKAKIRL